MNIGQFDPSGGDLGDGFLVPIDQFELEVIRAAHFLRGVRKLCKDQSIYTDKHWKVGLGIATTDKDTILLKIERLREILPYGIDFYKVSGRALFEVRSPGGGITTQVICYLVTINKEEEK